MGATGTGSIKPVVCSLLFTNEQQEGEEGAVSSGAWEHASARAGQLLGTGVIFWSFSLQGQAGTANLPVTSPALPTCLSPAQPPSAARDHVVLACTG